MLLLTIISFQACKKQDIKTGEASKNEKGSIYADKATVERVKQAILANGQQASTLITVNQPSTDTYFSDGNDKRIDLKNLLRSRMNGRMDYSEVCDFQYDENYDPIEDMFPTAFNLNSIGFIFDCGPGLPNTYRISLKWGIAVRNLIQAQNNYGPGGNIIRSRYTLKVKNSAGTVIASYTNNYLQAENIQDMGDWETDPVRKLYAISASINVPSSIITNGVTFETTLSLATNCNLTPQVSAVHTTASISSLNAEPCKRTDKVWINPGTGPGGVATAAGTFIVCTVPTGYNVSANHNIQWRLKTSPLNTWEAQTSSIYPLVVEPEDPIFWTFGTYTGVISLPGTTAGSGTWLIRYKNDNTCTPTAPWFIEIWPL